MRGLPARLHLPWDRWPEEDRRLWQAAVADDDPFGDAAGAHLSHSTRRKYWFGWRRFLGFLTLRDPAALDLPPVERVTPERVRAFVTHLAETNSQRSTAIQIESLYGAARIMMPEHDWRWLKAIKARLYATAPPPQLGPVITSLQLLNLGIALMDESAPMPERAMRLADAVRYRDGLMIALLAFLPIRRRNFAALELGTHLVREGDSWWVTIPSGETKNRTLIEGPIASQFIPYLETYLQVVRPVLLRRHSSNALWIGYFGNALTDGAVLLIVTRHAERRLGLRVSPHDARDAAATTWAIAAPQQIAVARDLLGHAHLHTTGKHYIRARGVEASRVQAGLIAGLRAPLRRPKRS